MKEILMTTKTLKWMMSASLLLLCAYPAGAEESSLLVLRSAPRTAPLLQAATAYFMRHHVERVAADAAGEAELVEALCGGTCDAILLPRPLTPEELASATQSGRVPQKRLIAFEALGIIVHPQNPVGTLSRSQLRDIFAGRLDRWAQAGGDNIPILPLALPQEHDQTTFFSEFVMQDSGISPNASTVERDGDVRKQVRQTPGAIGYVGAGFTEQVKTLAVDGVPMNVLTINSRAYPLARPIYLFWTGAPDPMSPLGQFLAMFDTPVGQELATSRGFVPFSPPPAQLPASP
jgi:phosphate transport system substrate-binding protein